MQTYFTVIHLMCLIILGDTSQMKKFLIHKLFTVYCYFNSLKPTKPNSTCLIHECYTPCPTHPP